MIKKKVNYINFVCLFLLLLMLVSFVQIPVAFAENVYYTNALDDLKKADNFEEDKYILNEKDYSLQFIQIAESEDKELFVYVYQPSGQKYNLSATSISFSTGINDNFYPQLYKLKKLNSNGVFFKYLVEDFKVKNDALRYYDLVRVSRSFNANYDEELDNSQTVSEVPFEIGKLWTVCTLNNKVYYNYEETQTIDITDKYVGFVRYDDGYTGLIPNFKPQFCKPGYDSHFVAFNTDKPIEKLLEATVIYDSQFYHYSKSKFFGGDEKFYDIEREKVVELDEKDRVALEVPDSWFNSYNYEFERIQTMDEFLSGEDRNYVFNKGVFNKNTDVKITDEGKQELEGKQWVLRFVETLFEDYEVSGSGTLGTLDRIHTINKTLVGNVSILRLKFETDGIIYNLGVIDNKQTGDGVPDNETNVSYKINSLGRKLILIGIVVVLLILFIAFFPLVVNLFVFLVKVICKIICCIFKGLWWLIKLPFEIFKK